MYDALNFLLTCRSYHQISEVSNQFCSLMRLCVLLLFKLLLLSRHRHNIIQMNVVCRMINSTISLIYACESYTHACISGFSIIRFWFHLELCAMKTMMKKGTWRLKTHLRCDALLTVLSNLFDHKFYINYMCSQCLVMRVHVKKLVWHFHFHSCCCCWCAGRNFQIN